MDVNDRRKRASSEAADWFARLQAGGMGREEREQFVEWLRESHVHVAETLRVAQIHGALERFQRWTRISTGPKTDTDNVIQLPPATERSSQDPPPRDPAARMQAVGLRLRLIAAAATVSLIVGAVIGLPRILGQVIETDRGERREVVLSDGSLLQIDPQTRLRIRYSADIRRVSLERGRALFHVAKNPNRPFLVQANDTTVQAVGTAFGVERRTQAVTVTVVEGKVAVFPTSDVAMPAIARAGDTSNAGHGAAEVGVGTEPESETSPGIPREGGDRMLFLTANHQVTIQGGRAAGGRAAQPVQEVDSGRALAWAEGRLIFENEELGRAITEFNRYNRVQLAVGDAELAAKPVSGVFNAADPEAFIGFLESVAPVEIVRDGDRSITIESGRAH